MSRVEYGRSSRTVPSLLSLRHGANVIRGFSGPGALVSGIVLLTAGSLSLVLNIVMMQQLIELIQDAPIRYQMSVKRILFAFSFFFPYMVSRLT